MRIGHGFDVHAFGGKDTKIILGGTSIAYSKKLIAHSDGDVLFHALTDAFLGSLALGDIGKMYPSENSIFKGIDSSIMLIKAWNKVKEKNYFINNIDITLILQKPKISPYLIKIRKNISKILNTNIKNISVKATSTDKLGFIGRNEGIACEALVLINK